MLPWQYMAIVICFVVNIIAKYLDWGGFKVVLEWNARGPLLFVFQYIYYLAEGFLISLIIVFGQKACERWFHNEKLKFSVYQKDNFPFVVEINPSCGSSSHA